MAFEAPSPTRSRAVTFINSATTPATIDYPDTVVSGDTLILVVGVDDTSQNIVASGWTELNQTDISGAVGETGAVFWRDAAGTEGGTTFQISFDVTSRDVAAVVYAIPGGTPEIATATGSSTSLDPPSLSPSGGDATYLWLIAGVTDGTSLAEDWPEGFGGWVTGTPPSPSGSFFAAERLLTAATLNPAAVSMNSVSWVAWTVAVPVTVSAGNFPTVEGVAESTWGSASSQTLNLPTGITDGDLLLAEIATTTAVTPSITGWSTLVGPSTTGGLETGTVMYKEADGTESGSVTVTLSGAGAGAATCRRISGTDITKLEGSISAAAASTTVAPPTLTPASGSDEVLWLVGFTGDSTASRPASFATATPQPWSFNYATAPAWIWVDSGVYSGCSALEAASVTPDPFLIQASRRHVVWTVAVYPTEAPPPPPPSGGGNRMGTDRAIRKPPRTPR